VVLPGLDRTLHFQHVILRDMLIKVVEFLPAPSIIAVGANLAGQCCMLDRKFHFLQNSIFYIKSLWLPLLNSVRHLHVSLEIENCRQCIKRMGH
jgi:hypothetical protein